MRYSRQEILIGSRNQKKLGKLLVTIIGCGATGSAAAEYLVRAGVRLRLIDRDVVELSNLQRQLYREQDVGRPKAEALRERLEEVNSEARIELVSDDLNTLNIEYLSGSTLVLDGTDNMGTRFLINDFCLKNKIAFTYAAAVKSEGLFTLMVPKETPCMRCFLSPMTTDTCETSGVMGPVAGMIGIVSATEAIKYIIGKDTLKGKLLHVDAYRNVYELMNIPKKSDCPACSGVYEFLDKAAEKATRLCDGTYQVLLDRIIDISRIAKDLKKNSDFHVALSGRNFAKLSHKKYAMTLFRNRMIIQNAKNEKDAKMLVAKILGV